MSVEAHLSRERIEIGFVVDDRPSARIDPERRLKVRRDEQVRIRAPNPACIGPNLACNPTQTGFRWSRSPRPRICL